MAAITIMGMTKLKNFFRSYSPNRISWSLRKLRLPIGPDDLVLEIGSGADPHYRSDVIADKFTGNAHRWQNLVVDRPFVLADGEHLPFKDKSFDYIIAFHVLEHVDQPEKFLSEIMRVGRAGYIETPNAIFERMIPYDVHKLEIMDINHVLHITKKPGPRHDRFLNDMNIVSNLPGWHDYFYSNPKQFHVRYHWQDKIEFQVHDYGADCSWQVDASAENEHGAEPASPGFSLRKTVLSVLRKLQKIRSRGRAMDLNDILCCPECRGDLSFSSSDATCTSCNLTFRMLPHPDFVEALNCPRQQSGAVLSGGDKLE